jgi:hypothetical protein
VSPVLHFRLDLGFHPSGEHRPSPTFRGVLGDFDETKTRETSSGPVVSVRERVVFHHLFRFPSKCAAYTHFPRRISPQLQLLFSSTIMPPKKIADDGVMSTHFYSCRHLLGLQVQRFVEQQQVSLKWITQGLSNSGRKRSKLSLSSNPAITIQKVSCVPNTPNTLVRRIGALVRRRDSEIQVV